MDVANLHIIAVAFQDVRHAAPDAEVFYDMLSDGLVWSDELPQEFLRDIHLVRPVLRHRTCIILGEPSHYEPWWNEAKRLFPDWVGFLAARAVPSEALRKLYQDGRARAAESVRRHMSS